MSNYYAVIVRTTFGVLADSVEEAEALAQKLVPIDEAPAQASTSHEASFTLNQSDSIRRYAVNYEP